MAAELKIGEERRGEGKQRRGKGIRLTGVQTTPRGIIFGVPQRSVCASRSRN